MGESCEAQPWALPFSNLSFIATIEKECSWMREILLRRQICKEPDANKSLTWWYWILRLAGWWRRDISSLDNDLTLASRAVRALYTVWAVRLHWGRHEITCPEDFMLILSFYPLILYKSLGFDLFFLTVREQKSTWKNYYKERGLKLFSGKTFCNHIKVLVGSPI